MTALPVALCSQSLPLTPDVQDTTFAGLFDHNFLTLSHFCGSALQAIIPGSDLHPRAPAAEGRREVRVSSGVSAGSLNAYVSGQPPVLGAEKAGQPLVLSVKLVPDLRALGP